MVGGLLVRLPIFGSLYDAEVALWSIVLWAVIDGCWSFCRSYWNVGEHEDWSNSLRFGQ